MLQSLPFFVTFACSLAAYLQVTEFPTTILVANTGFAEQKKKEKGNKGPSEEIYPRHAAVMRVEGAVDFHQVNCTRTVPHW